MSLAILLLITFLSIYDDIVDLLKLKKAQFIAKLENDQKSLGKINLFYFRIFVRT
jgi:hypothetical protein